MKTKEEVLKPYVERILRHTEIVDKDNALLAMEKYANEVMLSREKGWIPIKEEIPEDYKRVIYFDSRERGSIEIGYFVWSQSPCEYVTHWMELPPKP